MRLNKDVRVYDGGLTLVGGTPTRAVYLSQRAASRLSARSVCVRDRVSAAVADHLLEMGMGDPLVDSLPGIDSSQVTFVVPTHDRPQGLARLMASIEPGSPIIVVDDASRAGATVARVVADRGATLVTLPENMGPAGARNAGLSRVTTPFVAFADDDVVLEQGCVSTLLKHFNDPQVALAAPRVVGLQGGARRSWIQRYEDARSSLDLGTVPSTVRPYALVAWVPAACVVARVEALGSGFSADMRKGEDVDLVWRLAEAGWRVRYEPAARAFHENRSGTRQWVERKAFYGSSGALLARRHPRSMASAVMAPWNAGVAAVLLAQRRWSLPAALLLTLVAAARISKKVRRSRQAAHIGVALAGDGAMMAISQTAALVLRHWWPATAVACLFSWRARRAAVVIALADAAVEYARSRPQLDPVRFAVARRVDDLAYGLGLWSGAATARSLRALLPLITLRGPASGG